MSVDESSSVAGDQALIRQVEVLERKSAALTTALNRSRQASLALFFIALAFVLVTAGAFYRLGKNLISEQNQARLTELAKIRLEKRSDDYLREVRQLVEKVSPKLTAAFAEQAKKDLPTLIAAVEKERQPVLKNIETRVGEAVKKREGDLVQSKRQLVLDEFPAIKDEQTRNAIVSNLQAAVEELIRKHYLDQLHREILALGDNLDAFPAADPSNDPNELPLEDQLTGNLIELLSLKLSQSSGVTAAE